MKTYELRSPEDIAALTEEWGFLPFFARFLIVWYKKEKD